MSSYLRANQSQKREQDPEELTRKPRWAYKILTNNQFSNSEKVLTLQEEAYISIHHLGPSDPDAGRVIPIDLRQASVIDCYQESDEHFGSSPAFDMSLNFEIPGLVIQTPQDLETPSS